MLVRPPSRRAILGKWYELSLAVVTVLDVAANVSTRCNKTNQTVTFSAVSAVAVGFIAKIPIYARRFYHILTTPDSLARPLACSLARSFTCPLACLLSRTLIHSLTHSLPLSTVDKRRHRSPRLTALHARCHFIYTLETAFLKQRVTRVVFTYLLCTVRALPAEFA